MFPDRRDIVPPTTITTKEQYLGNRWQRRHSKDIKSKSSFIDEYNTVVNTLNDSARIWDQVLQEEGGNLTDVIFKGRPFIHRYLDDRYNLPQFLRRAHLANLQTPFTTAENLNKLDSYDIFPHRIGGIERFGLTLLEGVSLYDIEQMPLKIAAGGTLELEKADIKRINRMFRHTRFNPETNQESWIRQAMVYLASQDLARGDERITIPATLRPLHQRLTAYFDYYKDLMLRADTGTMDELHFLQSLGWIRPWLPRALGIFIPARLGITPSSAIKLYRSRAELSMMYTSWWRKHLLPYLEEGSKNAIRKNALPADLQRYSFFDEEMDGRVTSSFLEFYGKEEPTEEKALNTYKKRIELMDLLVKDSFDLLQNDIAHSPKKYLEFDMKGHPLIDRTFLTAQNRKTLIFILIPKEGGHLLIEIDRKQYLYGLPAKLEIEDTYLRDRIVLDAIQPVLEGVQLIHAPVQPVRILLPPVQIRQQEVFTAAPREKAKPKRAKLLTPISRLLEGPEPANLVPIEPPKFVVFHSRDEIIRELGKKTSDREIDRVIKGITDFEHGRGDYKKLKEDRVEGEDLYEIRIKGRGGLRVLVRHLEGAFFALAKTGPRREIFNIRRRGN